MRIAILGTGGVGGVLGVKWALQGNEVAFASRTPEAAKCVELVAKAGATARVTSAATAVHNAEVVLVAVPWTAVVETLGLAGPCEGKLVIDCTNPLKPDLSGLAVEGTSAAEQIALWLPKAHVVKAFNTASAKVMIDPAFPNGPATMFYCGNNAEAKKTVHGLIGQIGFSPVDAGPLTNARHLESLAMLYIHLAVRGGWGSNCAFQMVKR